MGYATKMFEEFRLTIHNLVVILMMPSPKMILDMGTLEVDFHMYRRMIEKLKLFHSSNICFESS
jgi:hypothetical protein